MSSHPAAAALMAFSAAVNIALAIGIWSRRPAKAGRALVAIVLAVAAWNLAYCGELLSTSPGLWLRWGDAKYIGVGLLAPAWIAFILHWTGRGRLTRPLMGVLAIEPLTVLLLLAIPATHDLVRRLPSTPGSRVAESGPLFWPHLAYTDLLLVGATIAFVAFLVPHSHAYRAQVAVLTAAALLPWVTSLLFNLDVAGLGHIDLTPAAFTITAAVFVWGLWRQALLRLAPVAYRHVVDGMHDPVFVCDAFGHLVQTNRAAESLLAALRRADPQGPPAVTEGGLPAGVGDWPARDATGELTVDVDGATRQYEVDAGEVRDARGRVGGSVLVLHDITEHRRQERQLGALLAERSRVADTLSRSLRPGTLPSVPGVRLGAGYRPAGAGREIGGDFYDVHATRAGWAFTIGDVSGKGAPAAAVTALARYTLRALAQHESSPATTLRLLNQQILDDRDSGRHVVDDTYLTAVHGRLLPAEDGGLDVTVALGGHAQPLLVRRFGTEIVPVGRPGTAIGLFPDVDAADTHVRLAPGDSLVMFTDGVTEARHDGRFFGEAGLVEVLNELRDAGPAACADAIVSATLRFQDHDAADDIAVLVIAAPSVVEAPVRAGRAPRAGGAGAAGSASADGPPVDLVRAGLAGDGRPDGAADAGVAGIPSGGVPSGIPSGGAAEPAGRGGTDAVRDILPS